MLGAALVIVQGSQIESEHEEIIGLKAGIDVLRVLHTANEQACSDKRDKGERNFRYDQEAAEGVSRPADGTAAATDFEHFDEVWFCGFDGRSDANEHSRKKGHAQGKEKHMGIEAQINVAIQDERRAERPQCCTAGIGDGQANSCGENCEDQTFGEQLPRHSTGAGSERCAQANFFFAASSLSEQQIGQIDAGNQEDQADDSHHQSAGKDDLIAIVHSDGSVGERSESHAAAGIVFWKRAFEMRCNGLQRSFGGTQADAVFDAADHDRCQESAAIKTVFKKAREYLRIHADGNPDLFSVAKRKGTFKTVGSYADHRVRRSV